MEELNQNGIPVPRQKVVPGGLSYPSMLCELRPAFISSKWKRNESVRFCLDYSKTIAVSNRDVLPMPRKDDCVDVLGKTPDFSKLDEISAYWQVKNKDGD